MRVIYALRHNETLSLYRIQNDLDLPDIVSLKSEIEGKLIDFFKKYRIQPITLSFSVLTNEYIVKIDHSYVGNIVFKNFVIKILPKHIDLSTEKVLKLATYINKRDEIIIGDNFFRDLKGSDESISSLDFFYSLFIDKVNCCIRNGLIHGFNLNKETSTEFKGTLDINKFLVTPVPKNLVHQITKKRSPDLDINRIIKSVIIEITKKTKNSDLLIKSKTILRNISEISVLELPAFFKRDDFKIHVKRSDYDDVLDLVEILINGFDPDANSEIGFIPEYIINLDILFERICCFYLSDILSKDYFEVKYQSEHQHIFSELRLSGKIIPDIFISTNNADFKYKSIILDAKNKVSGMDSFFKVNTSDIYQLLYYSKVLNSKHVVLLYPGTENNSSRYILKGSQGVSEYKKVSSARIEKLYENNQIIDFDGTIFILWRINLEGSLKDTLNSFNELSNLLSEIIVGDVLLKNS